MPSHWTYESFAHGSDLQQGDLVRRTDDLLSVLSRVHQFFCDERYIAFAILTQSCDLVRRRGSCKAEHIQLAVVRELESLLPRILEERCGIGVPCVYKKESRYSAQQIVRKILNQNEQARGLFYLHPDNDAGIATPSVIALRISIALRREHYDLLLNARCGRLSAEYANKLGWLSGNLYSRIATPDWEDKEDDKDASAKLSKKYLESITEMNDENWVPEAWVEAAKAEGINLTEIPAREFATRVKTYAPPTPLEVVLKRVTEVSQQVLAEQLAKAIQDSLAETKIFDLVVMRVVVLVHNEVSSDQLQPLGENLKNDPEFRRAIMNHAGSLVKRNLKTPDKEGIQSACRGLLDSKGSIKPATDRLRYHLFELLAGDQQSTDQIIASLSDDQLFSADGVTEIEKLATTILDSRGPDVVSPIAKRLRNDQQLRALLQKLEDISKVFTLADD